MRTLALVLVVSVTFVYAQSTQPPAAPPQPPAATSPETPADPKTVEETASPELVGQIVKDLGITPKQAQGAAGTLFGLAKTKLSADDFAKVASAVPNMDGKGGAEVAGLLASAFK
jgi:pyruvate/2-oxoglutarate dehydrogenase complex dihydrolipoamide acyltransferase (E2) component